MLWEYLRMWNAAQFIVFALVLGQGQSAIDDVFRQVKEEYDDKTKDVASGLSSRHLQSDWCRYKMKGIDRPLVKLHYDMVIDERTYEDVFGKEYSFDNDSVSCEIHSVVDQDENRRRRAATKSGERRWPHEIPYQIDTGFDAHVNLTIMEAMEHWSRYTCLHFVKRTQQQYDRIIFSPTEGVCESYVGRIKGPQYISLDPQNCVSLPIILHEIGHAIGLYHEHTREDRDNNVIVNYENIKRKFHYNFDKFNADQSLDFNKPYDYHSIMHYGKRFFADPSNATSLEPTDKKYLNIIGEAELLSFHDVQIVNALFTCKALCPHVECPQGAFVGKNCECFCQGPPEDPVQRCNRPKNMVLVPCKPPPIDLNTYDVYSIGEVLLVDLSGTQYPDGTVLIVKNPQCSKQGTGNYTCQDGEWVVNINCQPDRCVYDTTRYVFKPNITSDGFGGTTEYVNSGTFVHVECIAPKGIPSYDSKCTDSHWDPALPNCDAEVDCQIENFDVRNVEVLFNDTVKSDGDVIPDGSSVVARCKGTNKPNIPKESQSAMVCNKGQLEGQIPTPCPTALYACPIVQYAITSGPLNNDYDVKCFNRYEMQPRLHASFQCDWRGVWKPFVPRCIPESCQVDYDSAKAEVKLMDGSGKRPNWRISSGQTISMACTQGHVPDNITLTCDRGVYNETSNKNLPLCKLVTCKPPPLSADVVYTPMNKSYQFKDNVVIQRCQGKLWFQGDQRLSCTADGTWHGTATCTPYCQHGTEKWEEKQNSDLIKYIIRNITVESYQECLNYCKNYDRVLCRAFAYGFDQGKRRCRITYANPSSPNAKDMLGARQLWSVWFRKCD